MSPRLAFIFGRGLPLGIFGFLVAIQGQLLMSGIQAALQVGVDHAAALYLVNRGLTLAFFTFIVVIYVFRGRPAASNHKFLPVAAAMVGSFILLFIWLVPGSARSTDTTLLAASDLLLSWGVFIALFSLSYLRNRFSITPEARGLVTTGPYAIVRHPIYLGELMSGLGLLLPTILSAHMVVFLIFITAQLLRMHFEEAVLRRTYPEYAAYARQTARLIPFVF